MGSAKGTGNRDIERPENSPVESFQRDGAGRPKGLGKAARQGCVEDRATVPATELSRFHSYKTASVSTARQATLKDLLRGARCPYIHASATISNP